MKELVDELRKKADHYQLAAEDSLRVIAEATEDRDWYLHTSGLLRSAAAALEGRLDRLERPEGEPKP